MLDRWVLVRCLDRHAAADAAARNYCLSPVAPPASLYDFSFLAPCPSSGLFLHGGDDEVVPVESVGALAEKLAHQREITIDYRIVEGADHFFNTKVEEMTEQLEDYLNQVIIGVNPIQADIPAEDELQ